MTITNLKMGGINKKRESVEQVTANLENFHHNIFDVETFPVDFHRSMFHLLHFPPSLKRIFWTSATGKVLFMETFFVALFRTMMHCTHPMILTSSIQSPCLCKHYQGDQSPWLLTWIKMTGGTPEVRSDNSLTLMKFDIWHLKFDHLNIWTFEN